MADCPGCGASVVPFAVPEPLREYTPGDVTAAALCSSCLSLHPADDGPSDPDLAAISAEFPDDPEAAVPMALAVGLCDSIVLYREELSELLERIERTGVDPLLVFDRLARDPGLDPAVDLSRCRTQIEQTRRE